MPLSRSIFPGSWQKWTDPLLLALGGEGEGEGKNTGRRERVICQDSASSWKKNHEKKVKGTDHRPTDPC